MRRERKSPSGFNVIELIIVLAVMATITGIAVPGILGSIQRRGVDGASRRIAQEVRLAQSHAISRGGQTRLLAFSSLGVATIPGGTNITEATLANRYRIEIRYSITAAWPALSDTPGNNPNVLTAWQDIQNLYGVVAITTANVPIFTTLGGLANYPGSPLQIVLLGSSGTTKTVTTNSIGKVTIL